MELTREKEVPTYSPAEVTSLLANADGSIKAAAERRQQLQKALQRLREAQRIAEEAQQRIHELELLLELKEGRTLRLEKELASAQEVLDVLPRLAIQRAESKIKKRLEELPPAPGWNPGPEP